MRAGALRLGALEFDAQDPARLATFWAEILGRTVESEVRLPGLAAHDFAVHFAASAEPKVGLHRMHFDLTSSSDDEQQRTVDLALSLGATHLDVGQRGDEGHVVLADPEGNEFCVIEAGNNFLANIGRIGALAGDGMPAVGYFWSEILGWPLVWDQDEETAIQAPTGGAKITWGGPPVAEKVGRNRLRWVLSSSHLAEDVQRLQARGAGLAESPDERAERVELTDPEGNEFVLIQG